MHDRSPNPAARPLAVLRALAVALLVTANAAPATPLPPELVGVWRSGELATSALFDPRSGGWRDGGGSGTAYTLAADGTYEAAGRTRGLGTCAVVIRTWQRGSVAVRGGRLVFTPSASAVRTQDACGGSATDLRDRAAPVAFDWSVGPDGTLTLRDADGGERLLRRAAPAPSTALAKVR